MQMTNKSARSPWVVIYCLVCGASVVSAVLGLWGLAVVRQVFELIAGAL